MECVELVGLVTGDVVTTRGFPTSSYSANQGNLG